MTSHPHSLLNVLLAGALMLTSAASPEPIAATTAAVHYAKPGGATAGTCASWAAACELRYALGTVAVAGDEIWVAGGVYTPGATISATFTLTDGVALYGGFGMTETMREQRDWAANVTVLSGDIGGDDITDANGVVTNTANIQGNNAYHVVTGSGVTNTAVLDGFTITGGKASGAASAGFGGGIITRAGSSPVLSHLAFSGNFAQFGGGIDNNESSPTLTGVTFSGNFAAQGGGGMCNSNSQPVLTEVTFSGNSAADGGGMYNERSFPMLTGVTFSGNSATSGGGGIYNLRSAPALTEATFNGNSAANGGGMYNTQGSSPTLTNVTFSGNLATNGGGGVYNNGSGPTLTNVTFNGNSAANGGSSFSNTNGSNPTVCNTLLVKGATGGNCAGDVFAGGSAANLADDNTCIGSTPQSANIRLGALGNYGGSTQTIPLLPGSAAINAGNTTYCPPTDQRGFKRVGRCDIGAYEAPAWIFLPAVQKLTYFDGPFESEPNNTYLTANGLLYFGRTYAGLFNDEKDYFSVYLPAAGQVSVDVTHSSSAVQLQLFYQVVDVAHRVATDTTGQHVAYTGAAGWYYIYLNAGSSPDNSAYTLQVTYP